MDVIRVKAGQRQEDPGRSADATGIDLHELAYQDIIQGGSKFSLANIFIWPNRGATLLNPKYVTSLYGI